MPNDLPDGDAQTETPSPLGPLGGRRVGRRALLGGALGGLLPAAALLRGHGGAGQHAIAQATDPAATPRATVFGILRSATPEASPAASPVGSPVPVPMLGQLLIVEDQRPVDPGVPVAGGELRLFITPGGNANYSPAALRQDFQIMVSYLDPLVWIDEVTMEPKPWLAESWKWSRKGTRIIYTLRDDVNWHDGSRLDAKDVVFSFYVYRDDIDSAVRNLFVNMESAEATDDRTVVVDLSQPDGNWLLNASSQLIMQRKQYIDHWSQKPEGQATISDFNWKKSSPIGTGPWKLGKRAEDSIQFTRNDAYVFGPPHAETLTLRTEADPAKRIAAWAAGQADIVWTTSFADVTTASASPGTLYVSDAAAVMFAAFNFNNPKRTDPALFGDSALRQALTLAIDRGKYAQSVFGGYAFVDRAGTVAQPWAYDPGATNPARDVAKAKKLLADAGYIDSDRDGVLESPAGDVLNLRLIVRDDARPELLAVLDSIVPDLKEIGVALDVKRQSADRFNSDWIDTHDFDLIAYAYNLFPGFTDFDLYGSAWDIRTNPQGWNPGGYANEQVDRAIRDILESYDMDAQLAALKTLQEETNRDLFGLWFGFPREFVLARPEIHGFQPNKLWQTWDTRKLWRG